MVDRWRNFKKTGDYEDITLDCFGSTGPRWVDNATEGNRTGK
jgi:hypothetical protein